MKPLIYLSVFLLSISCVAQKKVSVKKDTVFIKEIPAYSKTHVDNIQQEYFEILKSTNEQLNNYWTPVNWFLGALGVLFAVGAIISGYLLWRQSNEFKKQTQDLFAGFTATRDMLLQGAQEQINEQVAEMNRISTLFENLKPQIEAQDKEKINESLEEIDKQIEEVKVKMATPIPTPSTSNLPRFASPTSVIYDCPQCRFAKTIYLTPGRRVGSLQPMFCERCGTKMNFNFNEFD